MAPPSAPVARNTEKMNRTVPILLLAGLLAPSATAQQSLAETLPSETVLYLEIPDVKQFGDGFAGSTLGRIWSDAPMQEFLAPVLPMLDGALAQAKMGMEAQGIPGALLDPASYGRIECGFAFGALDPATGPDMVMGARLGFHDAELANGVYGMLSGLLAMQGGEVTETGVSIQEGPMTLSLSLQGSTLAIDGRKGMAEATGSLSQAPGFVAARSTLSNGQAFVHIDISQAMGFLNQVLPMAPPEVQAMAPMLISGIGLDSIGAMSFTTGWKGGESFGEGVISFGPGGPSGLVGVGLADGSAANAALAEYVPANANSFSIGSADFNAVWAFVTNTADQMITMAEAQGEVIDRSMPELAWLYGEDRGTYDKAFAAIGPDAFSWAKAEFSMAGGGGAGGTFIRVQDVDAVRAMFAGVMPQLQKMLDEVEAVDLLVKSATDRKKDAEGNWTTVKLGEYYQVRLNLSALPIPAEVQMQMSMMASAIPQPAFGITDDGWLVFSMNGSSGVRKAMKSGVSKPEENILSNAEAADFLGRVPENAGSLRWSDPRPVIAGAVTMVKGILPMIAAQAGDQIPVDFDLLPGPDDFTKHIRTSEAVSWFDGSSIRMASVGSFDGGDAMVFVGMGVAALAGTQTMMASSAPEPLMAEEFEVMEPIDAGDPAGATTMELLRLDTGLMLYSAVNGKYPDSLEQLLLPQEDWEDGFLSEKELGVVADGWGNAFLYSTAGESYKLYSCGPNGVDDGGAGDDLTVE